MTTQSLWTQSSRNIRAHMRTFFYGLAQFCASLGYALYDREELDEMELDEWELDEWFQY